MFEQITTYFAANGDRFREMLAGHIRISAGALVIAVLLAVPAGFLCARSARVRKPVTLFFGVLRIIPSLAILLFMLPVMGTGAAPATVALVLLAVPPILTNTEAGLSGTAPFLLETAEGLGMEPAQIWTKVRFPLALPFIFAGIKTAAVEIIASATLAARIGAGGLGDLIFAGIGLLRTDLLVIGGASVAILSLLTGFFFGILERLTVRYRKR